MCQFCTVKHDIENTLFERLQRNQKEQFDVVSQLKLPITIIHKIQNYIKEKMYDCTECANSATTDDFSQCLNCQKYFSEYCGERYCDGLFPICGQCKMDDESRDVNAIVNVIGNLLDEIRKK